MYIPPSRTIISCILVIILLNAAFSVYAFLKLRKLGRLKTMFFSGGSGADLETLMENLHQSQEGLSNQQLASARQIALLEEQLQQTIQKVGVVRFNPFDDGGGNFSFSIALLDGHNNGMVITSMYGRQQNRMYAKRITEGISENTLTEEEQRAIAEASAKFKSTNSNQKPIN